MNSKILIIVLLIPLINSCNSCDDSGPTASYKLTKDEISLIPFIQFLDLSYSDESGNILQGSTQPKIIEDLTIAPEEEGCEYIKYQKISSFLAFRSRDIAVKIEVTKYDKAIFSLKHYYPDSQETLSLTKDDIDFLISDGITDVSLLGFHFENVLVFEPLNNESGTKLILYSIENGIEFIEYRNGNYLKLIQ